MLRLNRAAGDHPVPMAAEMIEVLTQARQISEWTGGKFDVTFGALSGLWKFDHDQDNVIPDMNEVRRRLPLIDYRALDARTVAEEGQIQGLHVGRSRWLRREVGLPANSL